MPTVTDYTALMSGDSWNGLELSNNPTVITFAFATTAPPTDVSVLGSPAFATFQALTAQQQTMARAALTEWADASGITFVEVPYGQSDITFSSYDFSGTGFDGRDGVGFYPFGDWNYYSYPHFLDGGFDVAGHILLNSDSADGSGNFNYGLMLHEIGHALGLKHPTEDFMNYASGVDHNQVLASDNGTDTIMTQQPNGPQHLQALDIAAIQHLYGSNAQDGTQYASWAYSAGTNSFTFTAVAGGGYVRGSQVDDTINGSGNADTIIGLTGNDKLYGNAGVDQVFGGSGNDLLNGGTGADSLYGGKGDDTYYVDNSGDWVVDFAGEGSDTVNAAISYTLTNDVEKLILTGSAAIDGTGNALVNALTGNAGANILDGGTGADTMSGGKGDDTYYVDNTGDNVVESADQGNDTLFSSVSYTLAGRVVETLTLTGSANINATGNSQINALNGNNGNNVLDGGYGADTLTGHAGNDIYIVDNAGDNVVEASGEGTDTVKASVNYSLAGRDVENLTFTGGGNVNGTGNALNNTLTGGSGANVLDGGAGADTMSGGRGNDTFYVDNTGDNVVENDGDGTDIVFASVTYTLSGRFVETLTLTGSAAINATGNSKANALNGNSGNNTLNGGGGNDTLNGNAGSDHLTGSTGVDLFMFGLGSGADFVTDFDGTDTINVHAYNAFGHTITQGAQGAVIDFGGGNTITVVGVAANDAALLGHIVW